MSLLTAVTSGARAIPQLAWQLSAAPGQVLATAGRQNRTGLPFLAAVTGTAALGVVDWPVALLVAGGYLLARRQPTPLPPDEHVAPRPPVQADPAARQPDAPAPPARPTFTADVGTADPAPVPPAPVPPAPVPPAPVHRSAVPKGAVRSQAASARAAADRERQPTVTRDHPQRAHGGLPADPPNTVAARQAKKRAGSDGDGEPWVGYDQMTVPRVLKRLDDRGVDLVAVARYERAHRNRKMVQAAITQRRGTAR